VIYLDACDHGINVVPSFGNLSIIAIIEMCMAMSAIHNSFIAIAINKIFADARKNIVLFP